MIRKTILFLLGVAFIGTLLTSCDQNKSSFNDNSGNIFETNKVYNIEGIEDAEIEYAAYFPKAYTGKEKLPVLFLLDPHGQGDIPVAKYSQVANKYNYILIGSNLNRNGLSSAISESHIKAILKDVETRFKIDEQRLFIGGFSGGAKLAILYADKMPEFIGALACGGSLPISLNKEPHYYYVGIIGNQDFNYLEMRQSFSLFDKYGFDYTAIVFNGKHEWPPIESFEMGLIGFDIYAAKIGKTLLEDKWKESQMLRMNDSIMVFREQGRAIDEYEVLQQMRRWFYGIEPITEIQKNIARITKSQNFNKQLRTKQSLVKQEVNLRGEFIKALEIREFEWWKKEVEKINYSKDQNTEAYLVKQRLLNYISMASYMLIKNDLNDEEWDGALEKIKIYELVDSTNPDVYLMYAKYYLLQNNLESMKQSFIKAKELGLKNYESYCNDTFWMKLFNHDEIKDIL